MCVSFAWLGASSHISLDHLPTFNLRTHLQAIWAAHHPFELHSQRQPPRGASETNFSQWYVRQVSIKLLWDVGFEAVDHTTSPLKYTWHVKAIIYYTICIYMYIILCIYINMYIYMCVWISFLPHSLQKPQPPGKAWEYSGDPMVRGRHP